jgi:hypothetical protein
MPIDIVIHKKDLHMLKLTLKIETFPTNSLIETATVKYKKVMELEFPRENKVLPFKALGEE